MFFTESDIFCKKSHFAKEIMLHQKSGCCLLISVNKLSVHE